MKKSIIKWGNQEASSDESDDDFSISTMHHWFKILMPTLDLLVEIHVSNFYIYLKNICIGNFKNYQKITHNNRNPD